MKKTTITITFDNHNLPCVSMKNVSREQLREASSFLLSVTRQNIKVDITTTQKLKRFVKRLAKEISKKKK